MAVCGFLLCRSSQLQRSNSSGVVSSVASVVNVYENGFALAGLRQATQQKVVLLVSHAHRMHFLRTRPRKMAGWGRATPRARAASPGGTLKNCFGRSGLRGEEGFCWRAFAAAPPPCRRARPSRRRRRRTYPRTAARPWTSVGRRAAARGLWARSGPCARRRHRRRRHRRPPARRVSCWRP